MQHDILMWNSQVIFSNDLFKCLCFEDRHGNHVLHFFPVTTFSSEILKLYSSHASSELGSPDTKTDMKIIWLFCRSEPATYSYLKFIDRHFFWRTKGILGAYFIFFCVIAQSFKWSGWSPLCVEPILHLIQLINSILQQIIV